jgi:hypothetical protein
MLLRLTERQELYRSDASRGPIESERDRLTEPMQDGVYFRAERQMNVPPVSIGPSLQHKSESLETTQSPLHAGHRPDIERVQMLERQTRFKVVLVVTDFDQQATVEDGLYLR